MAKYRIMYGKHIPQSCTVEGNERTIKKQLSQKIQGKIYAYSMAEGLTSTSDYAAQYKRGAVRFNNEKTQLTYNDKMKKSAFYFCIVWLEILTACAPATVPAVELQVPAVTALNGNPSPDFAAADGSRRLAFPKDFGPHEEFRTEWWYYTGNLQTSEGRHFGFELTIFRVSLLPPTIELPSESQWYDHSLYFAHFAVSDIANEKFYAFERYSRPGPGLAGAQVEPYRVWIEDWNIIEQVPGIYHLQAAQTDIAIDLTLTDEMGVVLHGESGYSRKGEDVTSASYYYSQPRLRAEGFLEVDEVRYSVTGLVWKDHEFSTSVLDENQIGWDWFSLQFEDGKALMLFQLRERDGGTSASSSGTLIDMNGTPQHLQKTNFEIIVRDQWQSPHTQGVYPSAWEVNLKDLGCRLEIHPWMADQELHFPTVTYWEGAVRFEGTCENGESVRGNGYVELTGYSGNVPLP
ncbi:MAG TPA: lipocalin-like domain-containing protein [Anaerolineales bacterium]|nr:lipocalin-like domain-containing protein [Anaerolineales bacterium]